jgi:hypothetical protein
LQLIKRHHLSSHLFADDTQIYGLCPPDVSPQLQNRLPGCINDVADWMHSNRLQLKSDHITPLLRELHWLRIRERIASGWQFRRSAAYTASLCPTYYYYY